MNQLGFAEYLWIDGTAPTQQVRSKARVVSVAEHPEASDFPTWSFDGSSTGQARGDDSDCILVPVTVYDDPFRGPGNYLVLCEVSNPDGTAHASNQRALLRDALELMGDGLDPWLGFEQEYTLFRNDRPLGFPTEGYPAPQGPYYCSIGVQNAFGREVADAHALACLQAGIRIYGLNGEVMPGQWEFQIGYRGIEGERCDALSTADDVWVARYVLHRIGEIHGIHISLDNKPVKGDWNGAGMHTNFSTTDTRNPRVGLQAIQAIVASLRTLHKRHVAQYGDRLDERLTGHHETCNIDRFKSGVANRGASIRVPQSVAQQGCGYLEDRRPGANADPYRVSTCLISAATSISSEKRAA